MLGVAYGGEAPCAQRPGSGERPQGAAARERAWRVGAAWANALACAGLVRVR